MSFAARLVVQHHLLMSSCAILTILTLIGIQIAKPERIPDFSAYADVQAKKQAFFRYLEPHAISVNQQVMRDRARVREIIAKAALDELSWWDEWTLKRYIQLYLSEEEAAGERSRQLELLALRVDRVPVSLLYAQAAKESGWGTSRFARDGYNFFGHQCFVRGCGFLPNRRARGRRHEVARFTSPEDAVRAYVHNLNTHPRYRKFRQLRKTLREADRPLSGITLAGGLLAYSERGQAYIDEITRMIRRNGLE